MIKHIVLSGGGPNNIIQLGCLHELFEKKIININNIESVYATSAGALLGLTLILKYDINHVSDFFVKRPWHKVVNFEAKELLEMIENNGYMDMSFIEDIIDTFLTAKNISKDCSIIELYNISNIIFNIYVVELKTFNKLVINHENYPSMPIKTAILMSCALPPAFKPILYNGDYYIDGGMVCNYPINDCILRNVNKNEILGLHVTASDNCDDKFDETTSMPNYTLMLVKILIRNIQKQEYIPNINEIIINCKYNATNINAWKALIDDKIRKELYEKGIILAKEYITKQNLKIDQECLH
tara:strand:+ start:1131 stop:2024 length:894 start_codon:yes stop_codon:yes gene_type:complete